MTAVMRRAEASLQARIMMQSSMTWSLMWDPGAGDWRMKTVLVDQLRLEMDDWDKWEWIPSSSRTDSPTLTDVS